MNGKLIALLSALLFAFSACDTVDDDRIPNYPVNINLGDAALWNTYGVNGFGSHRRFILTTLGREPSSFPFSQSSATGFGGVLVIEGLDPFSATPAVPLAYDLACPYEAKSDIRVYIETETYHAICPKCGSVYDVTMGGGAPLGGPSAESNLKYGLRRYRCVTGAYGGYIVTN